MARRFRAAALLAASLAAGACGSSGKTASPVRSAVHTATTRLPGTGKPQVTLGDKNFTEQFVLGQLYQQALSAQGFSVMLNPNIGPTEVTIEALASGRLDIYPEYLDTFNQMVAGYHHGFPTTQLALGAAQRFAAAHGFALLSPTPFSDTNALAATQGYAIQNGLRTIGDLRGVAGTITLGAPPQFQQSTPGLSTVEQAYDFVPAAFKALDVGAQYQALDQGTVQVAVVSSTDGQLDSGNYTLLRDPLNVFGRGNVVPVVSSKVLAVEGPAFAATIDRVSALLTTAAMRRLNAAVDVFHRDPATVAKQFLIAHGLVVPPAS